MVVVSVPVSMSTNADCRGDKHVESVPWALACAVSVSTTITIVIEPRGSSFSVPPLSHYLNIILFLSATHFLPHNSTFEYFAFVDWNGKPGIPMRQSAISGWCATVITGRDCLLFFSCGWNAVVAVAAHAPDDICVISLQSALPLRLSPGLCFAGEFN